MQRSRTQIATSYAPGALFTYEGGLGCCVAVPLSAPYTPSAPAVQRQVFENLTEFVESWFDRAKRARQNPEVMPEQCIDSVFLDHKKEPRVDAARFSLTQPSRIGFLPDPLVFVCSECGLLAEFDDIEALQRFWLDTVKREDCGTGQPRRHQWRQMDVIFAHWSGGYCGLSPHRWVMASGGNVSQAKHCQSCGHGEYRLVTNASPFFSDWKFQCVKCLTPKDVVQADRDTLQLLKPRMDAGLGNLPKEWNMLPVSYRASQVFYVQKDSFILFRDNEVTALLGAARRAELVSRLMELYNFPGTPLTDDEVLRQLRANGRQAEAEEYRQLNDIRAMLPASQRPVIEKQLLDKRTRYESAGFIVRQHEQSPVLTAQVESSQEWARRYNPIRLALEHASLRREIIDRQGTDPSLPAISVLNPEVCDIDAEDTIARQAYEEQASRQLTRLGIDECVLVRGLDICEFSFGYTRVAATPTTTIKDLEMPVRLCAFSHIEKNTRPIYVLEQKNEGFYVRLNEGRVAEWLAANGLAGALPSNGQKLGGSLIETYVDFKRFLEDYKERTAESRTARSLPSYVYLLLHTAAHHFAHAVVEYSGLEYGSVGEYLFPADLAFLVYRRGMTPDLGNLSAMWRNYGGAILEHLLGDRALKCDSGSLCDQRGGACPACIMAPEVACVAGNNLLSRAALKGGQPPGWDVDRTPLVGYLNVPASLAQSV